MNFIAFKSGVLVAIALMGSALAQTTLHTTTTLVVVPTLVQTSGKELVFSLKADDFVLTDNGVPQKVTLEEESSRPRSLVVLMQTGGFARGQFDNYAHLDSMIAAILGNAPNVVSIVNFDSQPEAASPFTSDVTEWRDAIDHPDQGDSGAAILDSILFGVDLLKQRSAGDRRAILLISQEHDSGSKARLKEVIRTLGETNTSIYSMTFSAEKTAIRQAFKDPAHLNPPIDIGGGPTQGYFNLNMPLNLAISEMRRNLSAEVAHLSGGETSGFTSRGELDAALGVMTNHIRNSYILSFYPTLTEPGLHRIEVRLAHHPELLVSARRNYWAIDSTTETQH
ncbi:MAG TPA: VWA domain-containing protein [Edaphobacter sp.]